VSSGLAGSVLPSLFARLPPGLPDGHRFARSLPGFAQLLPGLCPIATELYPITTEPGPIAAELDARPLPDPMTIGLRPAVRGWTEQLDERSPLRFCTLDPSRSPAPLLRNRFQSLVRFPSRHAAVRSADEPVSPGFDPSCED